MYPLNIQTLKLNFENVNIKFEKGKAYGIIGQSGSGKSTFLDLLTKFIDLQTGRFMLIMLKFYLKKV